MIAVGNKVLLPVIVAAALLMLWFGFKVLKKLIKIIILVIIVLVIGAIIYFRMIG